MKITIIETKTISTEIEVEVDSLEEAKDLYYNGEYSDAFSDAELQQWNVIDDSVEFENESFTIKSYVKQSIL
jgi:hypothetical protein